MNVLLLFSDQHRADVLGCENHPDVSTPNLDKLAAQGVRFSRAYCQDGVCVPSRCSMFTGMYPRMLGCLDNGDRNPAMDRVVPMQKFFQDNGFLTAAFGKRHLAQSCDDGWSIKKSHLLEEHDEENYMLWIKEQGYSKEFARDWAAEWGSSHPQGPEEATQFEPAHLSARTTLLPDNMTAEAYTTRETIELLEKCSESKKPFFIFSSFLRPHQPYTPLPRYYDLFDRSHWGEGRNYGDGIAKPPAFDQRPEDMPSSLCEYLHKSSLPWDIELAHKDQQLFRDALAAYYAGVMEIDDCVGQIMDTLERLGLRDDTLVMYTSDHGEFAGAHGIMEKVAWGHNVYEDTLRVPLVISCPEKLRQGATSNELVELVDIYPTLVDICLPQKTSAAPRLPGMSLAGHLFDLSPVGRKYAFSENWSQAAIITERYKLGMWLKPGKNSAADLRNNGNMLFDRINDPYELENLYERDNMNDVKAELFAMYSNASNFIKKFPGE